MYDPTGVVMNLQFEGRHTLNTKAFCHRNALRSEAITSIAITWEFCAPKGARGSGRVCDLAKHRHGISTSTAQTWEFGAPYVEAKHDRVRGGVARKGSASGVSVARQARE